MKLLKKLTIPQCLFIVFILYLLFCTSFLSHLISLFYIVAMTAYKIAAFCLITIFIVGGAYLTWEQWHKKSLEGIVVVTLMYLFIVILPLFFMCQGWYEKHAATFSSITQKFEPPPKKHKMLTVEELNEAAKYVHDEEGLMPTKEYHSITNELNELANESYGNLLSKGQQQLQNLSHGI